MCDHSVCQECHTHPCTHLQCWKAGKAPARPPRPERKAEPALWPCPAPASWAKPAAPVPVPCWALDTPEPRPSCQQRFLPALQTASVPGQLHSGTGKWFFPVFLGSSPSLLCQYPWKSFPSFPIQHLQVLRKEPTEQCSNGTATARLNQESLCKIMSFSCKIHHFLQEMWGCFSPQVNKKNPDSQDKS